MDPQECEHVMEVMLVNGDQMAGRGLELYQ